MHVVDERTKGSAAAGAAAGGGGAESLHELTDELLACALEPEKPLLPV